MQTIYIQDGRNGNNNNLLKPSPFNIYISIDLSQIIHNDIKFKVAILNSNSSSLSLLQHTIFGNVIFSIHHQTLFLGLIPRYCTGIGLGGQRLI